MNAWMAQWYADAPADDTVTLFVTPGEMLPVFHSARGESCVEVCVVPSLFVHAKVVPSAPETGSGSKPTDVFTIEMDLVAASAGSATPSASVIAIDAVASRPNLMSVSLSP